MSINLAPLLKAIKKEADAVKSKMEELQAQGSTIDVTKMIELQLTMNKFSQISDLGSTAVSLFNNTFKTMIQNVLR